MKREYDDEGIINLGEGIIGRARTDYIDGAKELIKIFKKPMSEILQIQKAKDIIMKTRPSAREARLRRIYWYKDAKWFVEKDPYDMFKNPKAVFNIWDRDAWDEYQEEMKNAIKNT